jgi:transposase
LPRRFLIVKLLLVSSITSPPMPQLTSNQKHDILVRCANKNSHESIVSVARAYNLKGGSRVIRKWRQEWDGTPASLERKSGSGRPRLLSSAQVRQYIQLPIRNKNRGHTPVHYPQIQDTIKRKTGKQISLRSTQRYGREEAGVKQKRTVKRTAAESKHTRGITTRSRSFVAEHWFIDRVLWFLSLHAVSFDSCEQIAAMRRKLQRVDKKKIIFMDEVAVKLNEAEHFTLVAPGELPYVTVTDTSSYADRYDMIALCNGEHVLPPIIFTPKDRQGRGVKGVTKRMLEQGVDDILAQAVGAIDKYPLYLVADKASIHQQDLVQVFHDRGCQDLQQVLIMPTQAAKRMSPLDNALFHIWKERVRKHAPLTSDNVVQVMTDEWNKLSSRYIQSQYRKCLLMRGQNVYEDCPAPSAHRH